MAVFAYQGTGAKGEKRSGEIDAPSRSEALRKLAKDRIQPLSLVAKADEVAGKPERAVAKTNSKPREAPLSGGMRLSRPNVILFTDELADFLHSGLQLEPALQLMENRDETSPVKDVSRFLREKVRDGTSFSDALRAASPDFDELYCNLVAAGEVSGALAPLLRRQAVHLVAMEDLRSRVKLALIYPGVLTAFGFLAIVAFMTFLVPQMLKLFTKTGKSMPLPTYVLVQLSNYTQHYGLFAAAVLGIFIAGFIAYIRTSGRRWWDETKLHFPLLGSLMSDSFNAQFCQIMSNLLLNGLPLLTALKLTSRATGNVFYRSLLQRITDLVGEGASLTRAMKAAGHFPPNLRDLVKVGEQTGELGPTMEKIGERYDKIIKMRIDRIMLTVPLIIVAALGGVVFLVAWSMIDGIFTAMHGLQPGSH